MYIRLHTYCLAGFLLVGCTMGGSKTGQQKGVEKTIVKDKNRMQVTVKPPEDDTTELLFQAQLFFDKDEVVQDKNFSRRVQYEVDSSFCLTGGTDTLWPAYVLPVANGNEYAPQYIVAFDRKILSQPEIRFHSRFKGTAFENATEVIFDSKTIGSK